MWREEAPPEEHEGLAWDCAVALAWQYVFGVTYLPEHTRYIYWCVDVPHIYTCSDLTIKRDDIYGVARTRQLARMSIDSKLKNLFISSQYDGCYDFTKKIDPAIDRLAPRPFGEAYDVLVAWRQRDAIIAWEQDNKIRPILDNEGDPKSDYEFVGCLTSLMNGNFHQMRDEDAWLKEKVLPPTTKEDRKELNYRDHESIVLKVMRRESAQGGFA